MSNVIFTEEQIATFSAEEKEQFNSLMNKAGATVDGGFDIKAYLEKRKQNEAEEETYRQHLEQSFV